MEHQRDMSNIHRILDANLNRAREAVRVLEDAGRFLLDDRDTVSVCKQMRQTLKQFADAAGRGMLLASRDTTGDVGTDVTCDVEQSRTSPAEVATAAAKRLTEALRTLEEYAKIVAPDHAPALEQTRYRAYTLEQSLLERLAAKQSLDGRRLYLLLSSHLCAGRDMIDVARSAIAGGVDILQLREQDLSDLDTVRVAQQLRTLTADENCLFLINDRVDIALACEADGVHLGQTDLPLPAARKLLGSDKLLGRSTHSLDQATAALADRASYLAVGPMFATATKDTPPVGPTLLNDYRAALPSATTLVAVGGITSATAPQLAAADCLAVSSTIAQAPDPAAAAAELRAAFLDAKPQDTPPATLSTEAPA